VAARAVELVRRICPSNSLLSYNPIFKIAGNAASNILGIPFPQFRRLPPNHLRVRVGVGTLLINNHAHHFEIGSQFWLECFAKGYVTAGSDIAEIGCGCGRIAMHLDAAYFSGTYLGIDIDPEMIEYCRSRFPSPQFSFRLSPQRSSTYHGADRLAQVANDFIIAEPDSKDFIYSTSLFTHLLEEEMAFYLRESFRALRNNGTIVMSFFCMEHVDMGKPWTFSYRRGNAYIDVEQYPEAAIAYSEGYIIELVRKLGFRDVSVSGRPVQSFLLARK
jgi:SAM-dependent methyltransferase